MSLKDHPLPWEARHLEHDGYYIFDASGKFTGIQIYTPEGEEYANHDAEEIAKAIVKAFNPETEEERQEKSINDLVEFYYFTEESLRSLDPHVPAYMLNKIEESGRDGESAAIRAEMFADEYDLRRFEEGQHVAATQDITKAMLRVSPFSEVKDGDMVVIPEGTEGYLLEFTGGGFCNVEWYLDGSTNPQEQEDGIVYEVSGDWMRIDE